MTKAGANPRTQKVKKTSAVTGRPSTFDALKHVEPARAMAFAGATDREIADYLQVSERTLHRWKHEFPVFLDALRTGKDAADRRVEQSLYRKAVGYSFDSEKIWHWEGEVVRAPCVEHVPPSDVAAIFWLKNRMPDQYREKSEVEVTNKVDLAALIAERRARVAAMHDDERRRSLEALAAPARQDAEQPQHPGGEER